MTHPVLQTPLCALTGVRYPIVQTGMGWVAGPKLVAATANAGALGILAAATRPRPSKKPPAPMTGTRPATVSTTCGSNNDVGTEPV